MTPQYIQWTIQSLLYLSRRKNSLVHKRLKGYGICFKFRTLAACQKGLENRTDPDQTSGKAV